jgi:hypothetical protein
VLHDRIRRHQQIALVAQQIAAVPEYPIYREAHGGHSIYIDGELRLFSSEAAARIAQLTARADWLRKQTSLA